MKTTKNIFNHKINVGVYFRCVFFYESIKHRFSKESDININFLDENSLNLFSPIRSPHIVLLCHSSLRQLGVSSIRRFKQVHPSSKFIVCNVEPGEEGEILELIDYGVWGIIYRGDSFLTIIEAVRKISQGEVWMKRENISKLLNHKSSVHMGSEKKNISPLTSRENEIMVLVGEGFKNISIANRLHLSENTVKFHLHNIFKKLRCKNKVEAVKFYSQNSTYPLR